MRIGFFTDSYFPRKDGTSYTLRTWKQRLEQRGHEVHLYYPESAHEPGKGEHPQRSVKNPLHHGHHWPLPDFSRVEELDVVHCHGPWLIGLKGLVHSRLHGVPSVYTYHTPVHEYVTGVIGENILGELAASMVKLLERSFVSRFDLVTCSSDDLGLEIEYEKLPVGVDSEFFVPSGEGGDEQLVGYSGRFSEEKNLFEVLKFAENSSAKFMLAGEGRLSGEIEERAPGNVEVRGFLPREKLPEFYSSLDVFVTASDADTFSLSTLEANLCGTPVLAPDVAPFTETIGKRNGRRYTQGDVEDMSVKLEEILESEFSPREVAMKYEVSETVDRLEELYRELRESPDKSAEN